jgi:hypothetical protein
MRPEERKAIRELRALRGFLPELRGAIDEVDATTARWISGLEAGESVQELAGDIPDRKGGRRPSETMAEFVRMQKDARLALFALAYAEGMSKAEIGRSWGISRQLSSTTVDEALARFGRPPRR